METVRSSPESLDGVAPFRLKMAGVVSRMPRQPSLLFVMGAKQKMPGLILVFTTFSIPLAVLALLVAISLLAFLFYRRMVGRPFTIGGMFDRETHKKWAELRALWRQALKEARNGDE